MKRILFLILLLSIFFTAYSQDATGDRVVDKKQLFYKKAIAKDLVYSNLTQLKSLALSLGIEVEEQSAGAYRKALAEYYDVELFTRVEKRGEKIILERAGEMKTLTVEEADERTLHIIGKVRILLESKNDENKTVHKTLEADEIFIDLSNKEIMGINNVLYKDEKLEFRGDQFYYNFDINRGVLFSGRTKILKQKGRAGLDGAFFTGEKVVQTGDEEAILHHGKITTSDKEDPHYYIKATRIWLNKEGEWGVLNGVIYIGPIPFFWMPIFYHPKGLEINPALGYRSREGWFLNTTYYVFGTKNVGKTTTSGSDDEKKKLTGVEKRRAVPLSTHIFTINKVDVDLKLNEFYDKHEFYKKNPDFRFLPGFNSLNMSLRFFADAYTNIGFYWGGFYYLKNNHTTNPFTLYMLSDYALSRLVWKDSKTDLYQPFDPAHRSTKSTVTGTDNTFTNPSANPFMFRTSQWLKLTGSISNNFIGLNYDTQLEYASDTDFYTDFYSRSLSFTYIDLLAKAMQYGIESDKDAKDSGIFKKAEEEKAAGKDSLATYLNFTFSPRKYPSIYGLSPLRSLKIDYKSSVTLRKAAVAKYAASVDNGNVDDPRYERYFIDEFTVPSVTLTISGTLLDYEVFKMMPEKARKKTTEVEKNDLDKREKELYFYLQEAAGKDTTGDTGSFDYKMLLPFFSRKVGLSRAGKVNIQKVDGEIDTGVEKIKSREKEESVEGEEEGLKFPLFSADTPKSDNIKLISFGMNYSITNTYKNNFKFVSDSTDDTPDLDTLQKVLLSRFDLSGSTQKFSVDESVSFSLTSNLNFMTFNNLPLISIVPLLKIDYKKAWDNLALYRTYLKKKYGTDSVVADNIDNLTLKNKQDTNLVISYSDTLTNNFSFGHYLIEGTKLQTYFKFRIFEHNEARAFKFHKLNRLNNGQSDYERVDIMYYHNRQDYTKIEQLYSTFTLNFNLLPKDSNHSLSIGLGPKINWVIPLAIMNELKGELWEEEKSGVIGYADSEVIAEAKDYIYYRKRGKNIHYKIYDFYNPSNFWYGPLNYRKIFEDVTINVKYSYIYFNSNIVDITYTFKFILEHIGWFSKGNENDEVGSFTIYPDNILTLNFFNSAISYTFSHTFNKANNTKYSEYSSLSTEDKKLDRYKVIGFSQRHNLTLTLHKDLFEVKLPKSHWFQFSSNTDIIFNTNVSWKDNTSDNYLYLSNQSFQFSSPLDVLKVNIAFKGIDVDGTGYKFLFDNGSIIIGYNVTEIPVFLRYFKFNIFPRLTFNFYSSQSSNYYKGNTLSFALDMDLTIGEKKEFETKIKFGVESRNEKMYKYYTADGVKDMFEDLGKSFNFGKPEDRRASPFNLEKILVSIEHNLGSWKLYFEYSGKPFKPSNAKRYYWENTFIFQVKWSIDSENQLIKLFNKTKVDEKYEQGKWRQRALSLDPEKD